MANQNDFVIEEGVLKEYKGIESDVIIPKGQALEIMRLMSAMTS